MKSFSYPITVEYLTLQSGFHNKIYTYFGVATLPNGLSSPIINVMRTRDETKYNLKRINSSPLDLTASVRKVISYWKTHQACIFSDL